DDGIKDLSLAYGSLRKLFPLLGELEIHAEKEWYEIKEMETDEFEKFWNAIFQIRKLGWQKSKLCECVDDYERAKTRRGLKKTTNRLQMKFSTIDWDLLSINCPNSDSLIDFPSYSE